MRRGGDRDGTRILQQCLQEGKVWLFGHEEILVSLIAFILSFISFIQILVL